MEGIAIERLSRVSLRDVWENEATCFTPWLSENIDLLGEAIGIPLVTESLEENVGVFRADIIARDTLNDSLVLIENQLEKTDHSHLGQLITYASGLQAVSVVWIASSFQEEHVAALGWLSQVTPCLKPGVSRGGDQMKQAERRA